MTSSPVLRLALPELMDDMCDTVGEAMLAMTCRAAAQRRRAPWRNVIHLLLGAARLGLRRILTHWLVREPEPLRFIHCLKDVNDACAHEQRRYATRLFLWPAARDFPGVDILSFMEGVYEKLYDGLHEKIAAYRGEWLAATGKRTRELCGAEEADEDMHQAKRLRIT